MTVEIDLVLLDKEGEHFAVHDELGRLNCPRLTASAQTAQELGALVRGLAADRLNLDLDYLGVLAADEHGAAVRLVVAAVLRAAPGDAARLRLVPVADLRSRRRDLRYPEHFDAAREWWQAVRVGPDLARRIESSLTRAVAFVERHRAVESGRWGWEQYLERRDSIGVMSTAHGVMACLHAGRGDQAAVQLDQALDTLRGMQNDDGGWQIRWSLVGGAADVSITESTCACLWAFQEARRHPGNDETVRRGLRWLEEQQRPGGGWSSSAAVQRPLVFPTASAVSVLARYGRGEAVEKGVQWLREAQCPDGGWGPAASDGDDTVSSSPAYTAAALLALRRAGVPASDNVIMAGCESLLNGFSADRAEPWEATSFTTVVDAGRLVRMDFRHFASPWALAALCECGYDLGHPVVLAATLQLLALEQSGGGWRTTLTAPDITPIWAVHGAVYALRTARDSSARDLTPLVLGRHHEAERRALARLSGGMIGRGIEPARPAGVWRRRMMTVWLALLTVAVALLVLGQLGVLEQLQSRSGRDKILAGLTTLVVTVAGALAPSVIAEEYRIRRGGRAQETRE